MGLTKRKDSYYVEFRVLDDGKKLTLARGPEGRLKRWKVGSVNRTIAKQQEAIIKTDLMKGILKSNEALPVLFKDWGERYLMLEEIRSLHSYKERVAAIRRQLIPFFGCKALNDIRTEDIEAFRCQRRLINGDVPAANTVNNDHIILKHCLNVAVRRGLLSVNPATKVPMPDPRNERDRVLDADEWLRLYDAAAAHLKCILLVAYHLGTRLGEIVNLTWDRVDIQRGFINLRSLDTKTKEPRAVPMTPQVRQLFISLSKVRSLAHKQVFLYKGRPIRRITRSFNTAKRKAGVEDFRFHDLRHCAATNLRRAGVDTVTAMRMVGHKSEKMHKRYNSVSEIDLTVAANKLIRIFLTP
jgi:integrase